MAGSGVIVVDPTTPGYVLKVNSDGSINANGGGTGTQKVNIQGGATLNHNQVSVPTTAGGTLIVAANVTRYALIIRNFGPGDIFIGNTGLTISTGHKLSSGESFTTESTAAFYGIVQTTATTVSFLETAV